MPAPELLIPIDANLLADPDDLTTASWPNSVGCSDAASTEYFGTHRFTKVIRDDAAGSRYIWQSAGAKYSDGVVAQAVIRKGVVTGAYSYVQIYEDRVTVRGYVRIAWATKTVSMPLGSAFWSRWLDDSTVWVAIMATGAATNTVLVFPSEGGTPAAGDYVQVTMAMLEHALAPSYLPLELALRTALTGDVWWKVEVDPDGLGYDDLTAYLNNNRVRVYGSGSRFKEATAGGADFVLRNVPKVWSEGDLAKAAVKISSKIGSAAYIQQFDGFVDPKGVRRDRGAVTDDTIVVACKGRIASRGMGRKTDVQTLYTGLKICDTATPANSIAHKLAALLGFATVDCDFVSINETKDYGFLERKAAPWRELQELALQHGALLGERYDGKLRLISWTEAEWNAGVPEYVFNSTNVHTPIASPGAEVVCNRVTTQFKRYEVLAAGVIYKNFEAYTALTDTISIAVAAGAYWPAAADANAFARVSYERGGEKFPVGVSIQTPTVGVTGSGSDIEYTGGTLTLESFNGVAGTNPAKTQQHADASEIILRNTSGSPSTITKLTLRGAPIRVLSEETVEDKTAGLEDYEYLDKALPGKWATSAVQAKRSCERLREYGEEPRKRYENIACDYTPHVQAGAIVTFNPTADVNMTAVIEAWAHQSEGPHTKTRTIITFVEHVDFSTAGTGSVQSVITPAPPGASESDGIDADIADRPTYDEAITDGWDTGDGTTTPVTPTISAFGLYKAANLQWTKQANLTNLARYELQVSPDAGVTAYALDFTGTGYTGAPGGDTDALGEELQHTRIPFTGTSDVPGATTYHYRIRAVTKTGVESAWSGWVSATTLVIGTGDLGPEIINAAKIDAAEFLTLGNTGLIWYLPLDEEAGETALADCSPAESAATATGAVTMGGLGAAGGSADFGGADTDYIRADANLAGGHVSWAINAWLNADTVATGANQYAVSNSRPILGLNVTGHPVIIWNDTGAVTRTLTDPDVLPAAGVFYHIVGTHDDSTDTTELWVNGTRKAVTTLYDSAAVAAGRWYVGRHSAAGAPFAGKIDELRVYSRTLTEKEVKYLYMNPAGAQYTQIDAKRILSDQILARHISVGVLNALVAEIASFLVISDSLGWVAGNPAVPAATDQRAYMDKNELRLQYHNGVGWQDRFAVAATDATDNYTATLTSCPLRLDVIKAASSAGLTIRETGGAYGLDIADDGSVSIAPNTAAANYTLGLSRRDSKPSIRGVNTTYGKSVIVDSYDTGSIVGLQYYLADGNIILCYGGGTGGGTIGVGSIDLEAWNTSFAVLEWAQSAILGSRSSTYLGLSANAYIDAAAAWRYKTAAAAGVLGVSGSSRTFQFDSVASGAADAAITFQTEFSVVGGAATTLNLGAAAGGSARTAYLYLHTGVLLRGETSYLQIETPDSLYFRLNATTIVTVTPSGFYVNSGVFVCATATTAQPANLYQNGSGATVLRSTSSLRYKTDVLDLTAAERAVVLSLRPIMFRSLCEADDKSMRRFGFLAEEVEALGQPGLVNYIEEGGKRVTDGVQYQSIIPLAVAAIQDHESRLRVLEGRS